MLIEGYWGIMEFRAVIDYNSGLRLRYKVLWKTQAVFSPSVIFASSVFIFQLPAANTSLQIMVIVNFRFYIYSLFITQRKTVFSFFLSQNPEEGILLTQLGQLPTLNKSTVSRYLSFCGNHVEGVMVNGRRGLEGQESRRKSYCP